MKPIFIYFSLLLTVTVNAQSKLEHNIIAGLNIGAVAPVSLPATIREINTYYPAFSPSLGYECLYHIKGGWSMGAAVKLDYKGMTVKDKVMYMYTKITVESGSSTGSFEGYFTGSNETNVRNAYVTLPLYAVYDFNNHWRLKLGGYAAWLFSSSFTGNVSDGYMRNGSPLGEKVIINKASFDLGNEQHQWDFGVKAGGERLVGKKLAVMGNLMWGLRPLFSPASSSMDFKMYNIFLTLGVTYRI